MKHINKLLAVMFAFLLTLSLGVNASAQEVTVGSGTENGSITVTNTTEGETYSLYKIFDATIDPNDGTKITYTTTKTNGDLGTVGQKYFTLKDIGGGVSEVTAKPALTEDVMKEAEFKDWVVSFAGAPLSTAVANADGTLKFSKIPYGYYVLTSTLDNGALITVDSANPNKDVIDKNEGFTYRDDNGKFIVLHKGTPTEQQVIYNTAEISPNQPIDFDLGVTAVNHINGEVVIEYYMQDKLPGGMTYKENTVAVTIGGQTITANGAQKKYVLTYYSDTTLTTPTTNVADAKAFTITFPWTDNGNSDGNFLYANRSEIRVTYQAYLDPNKADQIVANGEANENLFRAGAKHKPADKPQDPVKTTEGPEKKTSTYVAKLRVFKFTGNDTPLPGAEFTLQRVDGQQVTATVALVTGTEFVEDPAGTYWELNNGKFTTTDPATVTNKSEYKDVNKKYKKVTFSRVQNGYNPGTEIKGYVNDQGILEFTGLYDGTYKLVESVVPDGYNKAEDITFTVKLDQTNGQYVFTTNNQSVTYEYDQARNESTLNVNVLNSSGTTMPSTGGIGTTIFYVAGSALVLGAGVLLFARKRMSASN